MGKRSDFKRVERDFYPTPREAVVPLTRFLPERFRFIEPCAGNGALVQHIRDVGGICTISTDIEPQHEMVDQMDVFDLTRDHVTDTATDYIITNPPWDRKLLHPLIEHLSDLRPTWLLFDADWPHTKQAIGFVPRLQKIVSIGRVKWIPDSTMTGKDNCCWYLFDVNHDGPTMFYGRA